MNTDQSENPMDAQGLHPDAPRHKSPIKWMAMVALFLIALTTYSMWGQEKISIKATVTVPPLTASAQRGREIFATACQECHGVDGAGGSRKGQPLIHPMYRENQFPDYVFEKAILDGKREKNWRFGPMPAIKTLSKQQIDEVTEFIRAAQNASGID